MVTPNWIFVKADKPIANVSSAPVPVGASKSSDHSPVIALFADHVKLQDLSDSKVSYQTAQFVHLAKHGRVLWRNGPGWSNADRMSALERGLGVKLDAAVVFDESALLTDSHLQRLGWDTDLLLVYVSHDFWCHPLRVAEKLRQHKRVLMILRHECAKQLFDRLLPGVPKAVQRPGVETSIFHPHSGRKEYDVLLGGSETPDYPLRQRLNRLVRAKRRAARLEASPRPDERPGFMSNPPGAQREIYAATPLAVLQKFLPPPAIAARVTARNWSPNTLISAPHVPSLTMNFTDSRRPKSWLNRWPPRGHHAALS